MRSLVNRADEVWSPKMESMEDFYSTTMSFFATGTFETSKATKVVIEKDYYGPL